MQAPRLSNACRSQSFRKLTQRRGVGLELVGAHECIEQIAEGGGLVALPGELGRERSRFHIGRQPAECGEEYAFDAA